MPGVAQAFVSGVAAGDGTQEVGALVVADVALDVLAEAVRARLSAFKLPTLWLVVPDRAAVPMLASGKVDRLSLQRLLRERGVRSPLRRVAE